MNRAKKIIYPILIIVIAVCGWNLWKINSEDRQAAEAFDSLRDKVKVEGAGKSQIPEPKALRSLKEENSDLVGWLKVPGTNINYPVMQTPANNEFYMNHNFEKEEEIHGLPFVDAVCDMADSTNLIIYGHNMKDGTIFNQLAKYRSKKFCRNNDPIQLTTMAGSYEYKPVAVMVISAAEADSFKYYHCSELSTEMAYKAFFKNVRKYSIWSVDEEQMPAVGTRLITLSTCEYTEGNGRLVVIVEKIS